MKILISTPLFPPEINYPAVFSKRLASELAKNNHDVTVVSFVNFPENIPGVKILNIKKNQPVPVRSLKYIWKLILNIWDKKIVLLNQAGATSFMTGIVGKIFFKKIILKIKEDEVLERIKKFGIRKDSFTAKRIKFMQSVVFKLSDIIVFDNQELADIISNEYKIRKDKIKIQKHPEPVLYLPFEEKNKIKEIEMWENYIKNFEEIIKNLC